MLLDNLLKVCPGADRLILMKDGNIYPTASGLLGPQLTEAGLEEGDIRAVVVREPAGLTIPHLAQHDVSKPLYIMSPGAIVALGRKQLAKLKASIKYAHG